MYGLFFTRPNTGIFRLNPGKKIDGFRHEHPYHATCLVINQTEEILVAQRIVHNAILGEARRNECWNYKKYCAVTIL